MRDADWAVANMHRLAKREAAALKLVQERQARIPVEEQMRRFLAGEERWRVDTGMVTPTQYAQYEQAMLRLLGGG